MIQDRTEDDDDERRDTLTDWINGAGGPVDDSLWDNEHETASDESSVTLSSKSSSKRGFQEVDDGDLHDDQRSPLSSPGLLLSHLLFHYLISHTFAVTESKRLRLH